jgi:biopolymer transport protein TolR
MAMRKPDRKRKLVSDINIVPFTDVLLVLLVIFMVTTPLIVQGQIQVKLPKASAQSSASVRPVILTLTAQGRLFLADQEVSVQDLLTLLTPLMKEREDKQVIINADRSVTHGRVVELMDLAKQAGAERLAIATESGSGQ